MAAPTPGGGHSALRYGLIATAGIGIGLQDGVLVIFLIETLLKFGSTRFMAFLPLAIGGLISILSTPTANLYASRGVRNRQYMSYTFLYLAAAASVGLAFSLRSPNGSVLQGIILATLYRICTQTANFVRRPRGKTRDCNILVLCDVPHRNHFVHCGYRRKTGPRTTGLAPPHASRWMRRCGIPHRTRLLRARLER